MLGCALMPALPAPIAIHPTAVPTFGSVARIHKEKTVAWERVMPKLRVLAAFALIAISLLGVGVDFLAGKEPAGNSVTDHLIKSGFESP
jgi:hypothetical protein